MVSLREIDQENIDAVLELEVTEAQKRYVSTTAVSLAQAWASRETAQPFAIYADGVLVGFLMFGFYEKKHYYTLWKFLIDRRFQNRGYGRQALRLGIKLMKEEFHMSELYTGCILGNEAARHLYLSLGFEPTGVVEDNMEELRLRVE